MVRRRRPAAALAGMVAALAAVVGLLASCASAPKAAPLPEGRIWASLHHPDGRALSMGSLRGKVVLFHVLAPWANPALLEVPRLKALADAHPPEEFRIVAVVLERSGEMAQIFGETFELPYSVVLPDDLEQFTGEEGPFGPIRIIPTSVLVDREGKVVARMEGMWPERVLEEAVERLVARKAGRP